ncbi:MAG: EAL domain-containing protein [Mariprofundus sp.]
MTLSRQLISLIFITFLLIFTGTFWISVENTRSYLMLQLATQTQNAADSLGLSLVPHMQRRDIAAMDTMINASFDSGYYKSLKLTNMSGKMLIERQNTSQIEGVPQWFIEQLPLPTPQAESVITTGWAQSGRLTLVAHPGFAYKKLWQTTQQTLLWSALAFLLSLIAAVLILRAILRPLNAVEHQALAICEREFPILDQIPRTRELKRVVLAMNKMSAKLQAMINKLSQRAEQMRQQAHGDALTGVGNRRAFQARLEHAIHDREQGGSGSVAVIRVGGLSDYNQQHGNPAGDELLIEVANRLANMSTKLQFASVARISGTDFAIILPLTDINIASEFGQSVSDNMSILANSLNLDELAHTGIALFHQASSIGEIMADADAALASASHLGSNAFVIQSKKSEAMGNLAWKQLIEHALQDNRIRLLAQPVIHGEQQVLYNEILIRIQDETGKAVAAGVFASMADRLNMNDALDRFVIDKAITLINNSNHSSMRLAVNLSPLSIASISFRTWLGEQFNQHRGLCEHLLFEVSEHALLQDIEQAVILIELLHSHHVQIVMEHFGTRLSSFQALRQLKVDYIKLSGSYTRDIANNSDNRFFIQTLTDIAHGLDINIIAEQIESTADAEAMLALGINAMQGYYFGEPAPLAD